IKAFTDASQLMPGDKTGPDLLREAQRQRDVQAAADLAARKAAEAKAAEAKKAAEAQKTAEAQKAAQVQQLLDTGRKALAAKQLDAAGKAFTDAAKLAPNDPNVARALQDLEQTRRNLAADNDKAKRKAAYDAAINAGRVALAAKRFDDALK